MAGADRQSELQTQLRILSDPTARDVVSSKLDPNEHLLWAGRPRLAPLIAYSSLAGIVGVGGVLLRGRPQDLAVQWYSHSQVLPLCLLILVIAGIFLFVGAGIFYGVTDKRALFVSTRSWPSRKVDFVNEYGIPATISRWPFGLVWFSGRAGTTFDGRFSNSRPYFVFLLGQSARAVYEIAISAQREILDEADQATIAAASTRSR